MTDPPVLRGHLPHGVQDLLLGEAAARREAEASLRALFSRWGYNELIPPTFEYEETLIVGAGEGLRRAMYRFFDREGNTLALRADFTTQIARLVATKLLARPLPLRCFYIGSVFRYEEPQAGRQREFTQAGVELVGVDSPSADGEVVALAVAALEALGLRQFQINLGHMGIFRALTRGLPAEALGPIREATDHRNLARLTAALDTAGVTGQRRALLLRLPDLIGGPEVLDEARAFGGEVTQAAETLMQVYDLLAAYDVADRVILDLGEVRGMDYYTGITFRGVAPGLGWPILSGGRYDELIGQFGRPLPAVGFGLGVERALLARPRQDAPRLAPDLVMGDCGHLACLALAQRLRQVGLRVEVDVLGRDGAELWDHARREGTNYALRCEGDGGPWILTAPEGERLVTAEELLKEMTK